MIRARPTPEDDTPTKAGYPALVRDVIEQGIIDAVKGDTKAIAWINSRAFEYWCDWHGANPDYMRRKTMTAIGCAQREARRFFTDDELNRAICQHEHGKYWKTIVKELGTNINAMLVAVRATGYYEATRNGGHGQVVNGMYVVSKQES